MRATTPGTRWRWRGSVALVAVAAAFFIYPLIEQGPDVIDSDWPAFATGARLIVHDPAHLYDLAVQRQVQLAVTGGRVLVTPGIHGILPFLAPAWVALAAVPFDALGVELGGRLWILAGLLALGAGLWLAVRPRPLSAALPAFASAPTALLLLNAQLDGFVALGLGAALALRSRPYLAGAVLGLTLMKPQLVLPLGVALLVSRRWRILAGWAAAGAVLLAATLLIEPRWLLDWLGPAGNTVAPVSREVDLPHLGTLLPSLRTPAVALLALVAVTAPGALAPRRRAEPRAAAAIVIAGGVLAAPHALPADLVLVAFGLAVWGQARWLDWILLSLAAVVAAVTPAPVPAAAGILVIGWACLRPAGLAMPPWRRLAPAPASSR